MACVNLGGLKVATVVVIILALIPEETCGKRIPAYAGPWYATARYINNETDEFHSTGKIWARVFASQPKPKQLQYFHGKYYAGVEISDNMKAEVKVSKWSNNQWKRNAFVMHFDHACSDILFHAKFMVKAIYGTTDMKCPFPKVNLLEIKNQTIDIVFPQFPIMPYGRYLYTMAIINRKEVVGVVVVDGNVEPKL